MWSADFFVTHIQTEKISSWNGPTVHVCCFTSARASTKTFVSRVQKTAKKIVSRKIRYQSHSLAEVSLYICVLNYDGPVRPETCRGWCSIQNWVHLTVWIIRTSKYPPKRILTTKEGIAPTLTDIPPNYSIRYIDRTRQDPTHTLQQACCCIYNLVTEVKTIIVSPWGWSLSDRNM